MIIQVGPLVVTRLVVVDLSFAWVGSIVFTGGLVPFTDTTSINVMRVVSALPRVDESKATIN